MLLAFVAVPFVRILVIVGKLILKGRILYAALLILVHNIYCLVNNIPLEQSSVL